MEYKELYLIMIGEAEECENVILKSLPYSI